MARCESCNKFVSYGDPEFEVDVEASRRDEETVNITGTVEMKLPCADCSGDLRSMTFDIDYDVPVEEFVMENKQPIKSFPADTNVDVDADDPEPTERSEGSKNPRYAKKFYGFSLSVTVTANIPNGEEEDVTATATATIADDAQASSFDEC